MPKVAKVQQAVLPKSQQLPKYPTWFTLPQPNILDIQADHRVETDIDANGVGRVRVKPGYNANVEEVRYTYQAG